MIGASRQRNSMEARHAVPASLPPHPHRRHQPGPRRPVSARRSGQASVRCAGRPPRASALRGRRRDRVPTAASIGARPASARPLAPGSSSSGPAASRSPTAAACASPAEPPPELARDAGARDDGRVPAGELIGRERELASLTAMLGDPEARLVTVTGPGGVGKTRLALAAAEAIEPELPGRVVRAYLAAIDDPRLVVETIADAAGAGSSPGASALEAAIGGAARPAGSARARQLRARGAGGARRRRPARSMRRGHGPRDQPARPRALGRANVPAGAAGHARRGRRRRHPGGGAVRRPRPGPGPGVPAHARRRRVGRGDLPPAGRPAARHRARRRARRGAPAAGDARALGRRDRARPRGRARPAVAPAHAAQRLRLEL